MSFETYIALAKSDIDAARILAVKPGHSGHAAGLVQQAAEKLVKAILEAEGIAVPSIHQIGALVALLPENHEWRPDLAAFDRFTPFATKYRYPTAGGKLPTNPTPSEIQRHIDDVAVIIDDVLAWCRDLGR